MELERLAPFFVDDIVYRVGEDEALIVVEDTKKHSSVQIVYVRRLISGSTPFPVEAQNLTHVKPEPPKPDPPRKKHK